MLQNKIHMSVAITAAFLTLSDAATAVAFPVAPAPESISAPATLARAGVGHRGGGFHGHPGGAIHARPGGVYHGGYHGRHYGGYHGGHAVVVGGWRRPYYGWNPGGAIAAGAAIGFLSAATAVAVASSRPPANGLCWYYTDPSRRAGFWDVCP